MIPLQLKLRNFLSYGEDAPILDFTSFKLACLTGRNGHGKSALLDAITWAVWGEARKANYSRRPHNDLLRQNAEEMSVEFTFMLNECEYQVFREFNSKKRSPKLEFRVRENHNDDFILLTSGKITETQQRIIDTLGLDYKTFINSSFLQQGKADEFTRQQPKDRKEILCNILGLDKYEKLLVEAKRRFNESKAMSMTLAESLDCIQTELEQEKLISQQEKTLSKNLEEKDTELDALRKNAKKIQEKITNLERIQHQIKQCEEEEKKIRSSIQKETKRAEKLYKDKSEFNLLIERKEEIAQKHKRYNQIGDELTRLLEIDEKKNRLEAQKQAAERTIDEQKSALNIRMASLNSELEQIKKNQKESQPMLDAQPDIEKNYALFQATEKENARLDSIRPAFEKKQQQLKDAETAIDQQRQKIAEQIAELRGITKPIADLTKELQNDQKKLDLRPTIEEAFNKVKKELSQLVEEGNDNNRLKERASSNLDQCKNSLKETIEKLDLLQKGQSHNCPLCDSDLDQAKRNNLIATFNSELSKLQSKIPELEKEISDREKNRKDLLKKHKATDKERGQKENELSRLTVLQNDVKTRQDDLDSKLAQQETLNKLEEQLKQNDFADDLRQQAARLREEIKESGYDPDIHTQNAKSLNQQRSHEHRWNQLQDILKNQVEWIKQQKILNQDISAIQAKIISGEYAIEQKKHLQKLLEDIEPLQKELDRRPALHQEQTKLNNAPAEWSRLAMAQERLPEIDQELLRLNQEINEHQSRLKKIEDERKQSIPALEELDQFKQKIALNETQQKELDQQRGIIQIELGGVRQKLTHLTKLKQDIEDKNKKLLTAQQDERHYKALAAAFHRNGIPAMIVDQSLPELENDANQLLQRLTNGRFSLALESQRETQKGEIKETLDIKISDEMGTRDYEMFSGGEAFRTDLAIRIALSKMLCRRAGSKLQLLVIDEGFGTQDTEGLSAIIDSINEIQDEFEKIIVVTHLEELKEMFQARIEVVKDLGIGSRFEVIHSM